MTADHDLPAGPDPVVTRFLSSIMCSPGIKPKTVLSAAPQLQGRDLPDPVDAVIYEAILMCAAAGQTGPELVEVQLREGGHLARDVDRRIADRLVSLVTVTADPLQAPALAAEIMDRAEVRVMEARARDILERAAAMPIHERRDLMRVFWTEFRDVTERLDATRGKTGESAERPRLQVVTA